MLTFATILTLGRLALLPLIVVLLFIPAGWAAWGALIIYIAGALTDWLDGWVARQFDQSSNFGRFLDPLADKIFVVVILLMLTAVDRIDGIWVLAVIVILVREFAVAGLREFLGPKGIAVPVSPLAKWKTTTQMIATGLLIIGPFAPYGFFVHLAGLISLAAAAVLTALTGWQYMKASWSHLK